MQATRRLILDILRARGQATVDQIVDELQQRRGSITAVTVRHHLARLQADEMVMTPEIKRRTSPGRPQHLYALTHKAQAVFPNNYQQLANGLLDELRKHLPTSQVNVILEGVADQWAIAAHIPDLPIHERLDLTVDYLTTQGYEAHWEAQPEGYLLHTANCPYHQIVESHDSLCGMDMRLIAQLLGVIPRRLAYMPAGDETCSYFIPAQTALV